MLTLERLIHINEIFKRCWYSIHMARWTRNCTLFSQHRRRKRM